MPELPEVESVRRGLVRARIRDSVIRVWRSPEQLRTGRHWLRKNERLQRLVDATPKRVRRRGKYLLWHMQGEGDGELVLLLHLGMSGRCGITASSRERAKHTHLIVEFGDGREMRFVDPRRFGGVRVGTPAEIYDADPIASLGPEPLAHRFDGQVLASALGTTKRAIRDALLDQRAVAGIGNIYAVEACFEAALHPLIAGRRLRASAWDRLALALKLVLRRSIANGGTTLKDFRNVTGSVGRNQDDLRVYGRGGQPCPRCASTLLPFTHSGRSGVFCPTCQPTTRRRWLD